MATVWRRAAFAAGWIVAVAMSAGAGGRGMEMDQLGSALLPEPHRIVQQAGAFQLSGRTLRVSMPVGAENEAARATVRAAVRMLGGAPTAGTPAPACTLRIGEGAALEPLPTGDEAYALTVGPRGVAARSATPAGLLHAAQTLLQLARTGAARGTLACCAIADAPEFPMRGIYIEGGQERFGRILDPEYLKAQIRRMASLKMNTLVIEAYNVFPYASFPGCADAGTLTPQACREVIAEAHRWHVTLVPSLQTLAQAYELVWANEAGAPYRESTAPGLICPSNPAVYPFIKGLYRDLLIWFDQAPFIGIGCSEIDMQWQARYCPRCRARIEKGETVRDLLLGHARQCIRIVDELASEMKRPVRPLMWGDEFYMYGPGRDWVGIERIARSTVMGFWKYWPDYAGIAGLMERGYDILGVSAIYNHCFYLADLSPAEPKKAWSPLEQTGLTNIAGMVSEADHARRAHPDRRFFGIATASFSKHRLRAFDSLWFGFALNAQALWSKPGRPLETYRPEFIEAVARHLHDARTDAAAARLADAYERLDSCKSAIELANQTLHDVVGVVDTQEPGYLGNTLLGAWRTCGELLDRAGAPVPALAAIATSAASTRAVVDDVIRALDALRSEVGDPAELANLRRAAEKIGLHARRQELMIDSRVALARARRSAITGPARSLRPLAAAWTAHVLSLEAVQRAEAGLSTQGDPTGVGSLAADARAIRDHMRRMAERGPAPAASRQAAPVITEHFTAIDPAIWEAMGQPEIRDGGMETAAPGGWGRYSGLLSRRAFALDAVRPLVVEFDITPRRIGVDSQLLAAADGPNDIAFRFAMACSAGRFSIHTKSGAALPGAWTDPSAGWKQRSVSPEVKPGQRYHVRAEVTRRTWRIVMHAPGDTAWDLPFWDTGAAPMDDVPTTRLILGDVEPDGSTGATRWEALTITAPAP